MAKRFNSKAKGSLRERQVRDLLIADGWSVTKAGGSLGVFDLVACRRDPAPDCYLPVVRLIQVKSNRWPRSAEMAALREEARHHPAPWYSCEVWRVKDGVNKHVLPATDHIYLNAETQEAEQ